MVALAVGLVAVAFVAKALKGPGTTSKGTRAVLVPTADRPRTLVVPACNTGAPITARNAAQQQGMVGATVLALPREPGTRVVLVPRCSSTNGVGFSGTTNLPSAAFVLKPGTPVTAAKGSGGKDVSLRNVHSQVVVPSGSAARTVVVPPCGPQSGLGKGDALIVPPPPAGGDTTLAPACRPPE
jgi:hypothetical protein